MPEIDSLTVRIEADLGGLRRGLREAEQMVARSSRAMTRSLAGVERSLQRIGTASSSFQPPSGDAERRITLADRQVGALEGVTAASAMIGMSSLAGPVPIGTAVAALIAGAILGALKPEVEALLSNALSGPLSRDSLSRGEALAASVANLDKALADLSERREKDAISPEEFERLVAQLAENRSDLLTQLDTIRKAQDAEELARLQPFTDCLERLCDRLESLNRVGLGPESDVGPIGKGVITGGEGVETLIGDAGEGASGLRDQIESLGPTFDDARIKVIGFGDTQSDALDVLTRRSDEARASVLRLNNATRDLGFTFASAFEDAVVEGRRLSDVLEGLEQDILRILTRKLVTEPLAGAVTGLIGAGVGTLAGEFHEGGRVGSTAVSGRLVPASLFDGAPRFAGGGIVARVPRLAPGEVPAILHRGEVVRTPAQEAALRRNAGRPDETQIVVNIQTPDPRAFNESRGQIQAMLADAVRAGRRFR